MAKWWEGGRHGSDLPQGRFQGVSGRRHLYETTTTRPSGRALWIAGSAERSFGSPFKIQGKSQRVLEPLHYPCGNPADLAFKTHGWQRS